MEVFTITFMIISLICIVQIKSNKKDGMDLTK